MNNIWKKTLEIIREKINHQSFKTWFLPTEFISYEKDLLLVKVPNKFYKTWLTEHYMDIIFQSLNNISPLNINLELVIDEDNREDSFPICKEGEQKNLSSQKKDPVIVPALNNKYIFSNFVVGSSNQFAHAAALAVAEHPSLTYNPLFLYGGAGLGKTHLLHAIGHFIINKHNDFKIVYTQAEKFTNELINSIRYDNMNNFRNKYRNIDVLLIDDIQFIAGKERTEEEFFHTFNSLFEAHKQIVISSDNPPKEIPTIEERLRSRFEWGLICDIQPPELETKIAILMKKAEAENILLPDDVAFFIANNIKSNIRELEGCLIKLGAYSSLNSEEINLSMAKDILSDLFTIDDKFVTIEAIQKIVCKNFSIKLSDLKSKNRCRAISFPRQIAMYLCRKITNQSLPKIADSFGGKDHTTVMHACDKIEKMMEQDSNLRYKINHLISLIQK